MERLAAAYRAMINFMLYSHPRDYWSARAYWDDIAPEPQRRYLVGRSMLAASRAYHAREDGADGRTP